MKKIEIKSLLPGDVVMDIGAKMNVPCARHGNEYTIELPRIWGKGTISAVQFDGGFGLLQYDCKFYDDVEIQFIDDNVHPLKFLYCLDGHFQVRFQDRSDFFPMKRYHNSILASEGQNGHFFRFPRGESIKIRNVEIQRDLFYHRFNSEGLNDDSQLQDLFEDHKAEGAFYHDGMYSVSLSDLFKKIDNFSHDGIIRTVFLEGIALEVLSEQLRLYEDDLNGDGLQGRLREYELACIGKAADIIEDDLEDICTIPDLAHQVGLNMNKLQEGFKLQYNTTVNQYIQNTRMKRATYLLRESDYNVSEIVIKVGLNSKSYFSKIFKEAYGITPTGYRKKKRKRKEIA